MTFGRKDESPGDKAIIPFLAIGLSLVVAFVAPRYAAWFGHRLPTFTVFYLAWWPAWLAINAVEFAVGLIVKAMDLRQGEGRMLRRIDAALNLASALTMLGGFIALALPLVPGMEGR